MRDLSDLIRTFSKFRNRNRIDRLCRFHDISNLSADMRTRRTSLIQFYSSNNNIGNYLPVLGIWRMLGAQVDTWCMHNVDIDFDYINKHYKGVIIGGAGLLHQSFEPFWELLAKKCKLPMVVWGVGGCFVDSDRKSLVNRKIGSSVMRRCDYVNLRDDITAEYYEISNASISPCPTIEYLDEFRSRINVDRKPLYASHEELVPTKDERDIRKTVRKIARSVAFTDNIQRTDFGLYDILLYRYCNTDLVITTRLHGAIIAYGLSIPYIIIPYDEKLRAFHRLYGNGVVAGTWNDMERAFEDIGNITIKDIQIDLVRNFGEKVKNWATSF